MGLTVTKRVLWITNIPTPYRNLRYRKLTPALATQGYELQVLYMAWSESGRHWRFGAGDLDHPHRVFSGAHPRIGGTFVHFNPGLVWHLLGRRASAWVIGGYDNLTSVAVFAVVAFGRVLGIRFPLVLLAAESNMHTKSAMTGLRGRLKRFCMEVADAYIVPGSQARDAVVGISPTSRAKPFLVLPNVVDETLFHAEVKRRRLQRERLRAELGNKGEDQLWILPARLEPFKGVQQFIHEVSGINGVRVVIAGTGSQEQECRGLATRLSSPVTFLGQVDQDRMLDLYAAADLFVLPSLRDPSPLSAIEALAAGLPLLLSERAGNHTEVLSRNNGWLYQIEAGRSNRSLLMEIAGMSHSTLAACGRRSSEHFQRQFLSADRIERFSLELIDLIRGRETADSPD